MVCRGIERVSGRLDAVCDPKDYDATLGRVAQAISRLGERMDAPVDRPSKLRDKDLPVGLSLARVRA